jgi:hypothetical protein
MAKAQKTKPGERLYRWRVSIFGKTPARNLGTIVAPDNEAAAIKKAIEFFHVPTQDHFRVAAQKLGEATPALTESD